MTDLLELAARCEAADGPDPADLDCEIHFGALAKPSSCARPPAYTASVDAAMKLLPAGWVIGSLEWWPMRANGAGVTLMETGEQDGWHGFDANLHKRTRAAAATPALALCAAALRARGSAQA